MTVFGAQSRYAGLPLGEATIPGPDGAPRTVRYVRRRFVPQPGRDAGAAAVTHVVTAGERLDTIAARHLGDPTQFWRICDANSALRPADLTATPGLPLTIALADLTIPGGGPA